MKGREIVTSFNLIDEKWILVIGNDGDTKEISLKELFSNAENYKDLAGEMKTQDFAVLRILLAILQTVFSRFDANGNPYVYIELDEKYRQLEDIDEDDIKDYKKELKKTWKTLWQAGHFPNIVNEYLEKWYDRFFLFDDKYPFMQVTEDIIRANTKNKKGTIINIKNINRTISESNNKISLFSAKDATTKNLTSQAEITRWILTFHGYTGTGDKTIFGTKKYEVSSSKGWLFDIGGIYFTGNNLFETLMLNLSLIHPNGYIESKQTPSWEHSSEEILNNLLSLLPINNLSELYTRYSRAIYIDPESDLDKEFSFEVVKVPEIDHQNQDLELMTTWKKNETGPNKGTFTPKKHKRDVGLWRYFGLLALNPNTSDIWKVGLMNHLENIKSIIGDYNFTINSISMEDDGNATSWVPVNEIYDYLDINDFVATDLAESGWIIRIEDTINETKEIVDVTYRRFLKEIKLIRNQHSDNFVEQNVENLYFLLNDPFKNWLSSITLEDSKDQKIEEWRKVLEKIVRTEADRILLNANQRDFTGVTIDDKTHNIITAYNSFKFFLNKQLRKEA
nr:type I-E CRISPR-associated protein Cse1/CasA [Anaerococcus sp. mt242]